jgi:hypothetical protein
MVMETRKPKNKIKRSEKVYFTKDTEDAIVRYNETHDPEQREKIFIEYIAYPLDKIAENVINRFKFPYVHHSFDDIKKQVVSFLVTNLPKYSKDKGKAFSYFSVIAKNYLIYHNNNGYKEEKRSLSIHDYDNESMSDDTLIGNLEAPDEHEHDDNREFTKLMVEYWEGNVTRHFKKRRDIDIANAVIELFRRAENIENFNKKALYLMIREITDCKTGYITKVVNKMKSIVQKQMMEYYNEGTIEGEYGKFFKYASRGPKPPT